MTIVYWSTNGLRLLRKCLLVVFMLLLLGRKLGILVRCTVHAAIHVVRWTTIEGVGRRSGVLGLRSRKEVMAIRIMAVRRGTELLLVMLRHTLVGRHLVLLESRLILVRLLGIGFLKLTMLVPAVVVGEGLSL